MDPPALSVGLEKPVVPRAGMSMRPRDGVASRSDPARLGVARDEPLIRHPPAHEVGHAFRPVTGQTHPPAPAARHRPPDASGQQPTCSARSCWACARPDRHGESRGRWRGWTMTTDRRTEGRLAGALQDRKARATHDDPCRRHGTSAGMFHAPKAEGSGMMVSEGRHRCAGCRSETVSAAEVAGDQGHQDRTLSARQTHDMAPMRALIGKGGEVRRDMRGCRRTSEAGVLAAGRARADPPPVTVCAGRCRAGAAT